MRSPQSAAEVEALERATLQAVAAEIVESLPGWLLPMDSGTVGRARSAVPLSHEVPDLASLDAIVARYRTRGFPPAFRIPDLPAFAGLHRALGEQGFSRGQATLTQTVALGDLLDAALGPPGELVEIADAEWLAMYLGEGLDPVDGASRARSLSRAQGTLFARLVEHGRMVACGAASFSHGWLGVHGLRSAVDQRGRGLAGCLLHAMALEASRRGIERAFLQVDAGNQSALSLYARCGFVTAWPYAYWRRPHEHPA